MKAVRSLIIVALFLAGIIVMPLSSQAATMQIRSDGISITKDQAENYVLTIESSKSKVELKSYQE